MTKQSISKWAALPLLLALAASPAFAVNKDMVQLQTQVQELQDAVARLQQSNDERMGVLKDLVQQSADTGNKMSLSIDALQQQAKAQQEATGAKMDQLSSQVQSLNDSLDEIKAHRYALVPGRYVGFARHGSAAWDRARVAREVGEVRARLSQVEAATGRFLACLEGFKGG